MDVGSLISLATVIDGKALWETAVASLVAGVGVTVAASTAIYGFATFADARRDGNLLAAVVAGTVAVAASLAFTAAIVFGLIVMVNG
jgi:hypothetical protein